MDNSAGQYPSVSGGPAEALVRFLTERSLFLAAAESCTSGLVADLVGSVAGASRCFWGSFVSYSLQAKTAMLGVRGEILAEYGPVSAETARAMAAGTLEKSTADAAVSVTGLAGPGSGGSDVLLGTVWIGTALRGGKVRAERFHFNGGRNEVRQQAALKALEQILEELMDKETRRGVGYALCEKAPCG
ncbi:MAG: CinA family protein [Treponema sp.]|jgi:PncC family amidohydrolase|nr:CinA family protein [Treponema sp.]